MPTVIFFGRILPQSISIDADGDMPWKDDNIQFKFRYNIEKSIVQIECEVTVVDDWTVNYVHAVTFVHVRGVVDAIAFARGTGLRLWVEECQLPDSERAQLNNGNPELARQCAFDERKIIAATERERRLLKPLNDLVETLFNPYDAFVNCQRAIEGIGHLLSSDPERKHRWESMRASLNISREYLDFISRHATGGRHGQTGPINLRNAGEAQLRSWTVVNRFLEYRRNGGLRLSGPEFPLL